MEGYHAFIFVLPIVIVILVLPHSPSATKYQVINEVPTTVGGSRFNSEIGSHYTLQIMQTINLFIYDVFQQYFWNDRANVELIKLYIREYDGAEAIRYGEEIYVSSIYLAGYQGHLRWEFTSLIHHEMTHLFQWDGAGTAPVGLVEGVADYMILKSSYYPPLFAAKGQGDRWDQGYDFTARFLEYCDELVPGFVAMLNKKMRYNYSDSYFEDLTGKPLGQLWDDYKAKYAFNN